MIVKEENSSFESPDPGTYSGVCYRCVDLGTQTGQWEGQPLTRHQVLLSFEINETMQDGRPYSVSAWLTASLSSKAKLRAMLESWRGRAFTKDELAGFDLRQVLGKPCMLTLVKSEKGKIHVSAVSKLPKGMPAHKQVNPSQHFSLAEFDPKGFEQLPEGLQKIIRLSPEWQALQGRQQQNGVDADPEWPNEEPAPPEEEIPF